MNDTDYTRFSETADGGILDARDGRRFTTLAEALEIMETMHDEMRDEEDEVTALEAKLQEANDENDKLADKIEDLDERIEDLEAAPDSAA